MFRISKVLRAAAILSIALLSFAPPSYSQTPPASQAPPSEPQSAEIRISFVNAGFIVGVSAGSGTLIYQGKRYPLNIGGVSLGAVFGAAKAELSGTVHNLRRVSDISGTYGATEAGYALVSGRKTARLKKLFLTNALILTA